MFIDHDQVVILIYHGYSPVCFLAGDFIPADDNLLAWPQLVVKLRLGFSVDQYLFVAQQRFYVVPVLVWHAGHQEFHQGGIFLDGKNGFAFTRLASLLLICCHMINYNAF